MTNALAAAILAGCIVGMWHLAAVTTPHMVGLMAGAAMLIPEPAPPRSNQFWWKQ